MPFRQAILQRTFQTNLFTSDHQRTLSACCHNAPCMMRHFIYTCDFNGKIPKFPFLPCPLSQRLAVHLRTPAGNAHLGVHHRHDRVTKVELVISFQCHSRCAVFRNWRWEVRALLTFLVQVEFLGSHGQRLWLTPGDRVSAPHRQARRLGSRTRRRSRKWCPGGAQHPQAQRSLGRTRRCPGRGQLCAGRWPRPHGRSPRAEGDAGCGAASKEHGAWPRRVASVFLNQEKRRSSFPARLAGLQGRRSPCFGGCSAVPDRGTSVPLGAPAPPQRPISPQRPHF